MSHRFMKNDGEKKEAENYMSQPLENNQLQL